MSETSKKRLLEFAAQRLGRAELATRLKVTESTLANWMDGSADMTNSKALALADLVHHLNREAYK
jgi:DNA-binding transcriptional regulator YiaG